MKNIPKICHFIWTTGSPLSLLQYLSVVSFHKYNPDWRIIVHMIKQKPEELGERIYVPHYNSKDYFPNVENSKYIEFDIVDLDKIGIEKDKHGIQVSDILRLKFLYEQGGVYSDFDMLWLKPMTHFEFITCRGNAKDFQTTVCWHNHLGRQHYNASNIISEPGGRFLYDLLEYQKTIKPPYSYQSFNTDMLNSLFRTPALILTTYKKILLIAYEVFYPYSIFELDRLYKKTDLSVLSDTVMGIHWFNGHELSREYCDKNIDNFTTECSMTTIIKNEGYL